MARILYVENEVQKNLLECEYLGQFSDGHWENARGDHWMGWTHLTVKVEEGKIGRNFYAYDSWNLLNKDLLDILGDRMMAICNLTANGYSQTMVDEFNEGDFDKTLQRCFDGEEDDKYWYEKAMEVEEHFGSMENLKKAREGVYDMKKMRKEIRGLKKCMQTYLDD